MFLDDLFLFFVLLSASTIHVRMEYSLEQDQWCITSTLHFPRQKIGSKGGNDSPDKGKSTLGNPDMQWKVECRSVINKRGGACRVAVIVRQPGFRVTFHCSPRKGQEVYRSNQVSAYLTSCRPYNPYILYIVGS